MRRYIRANTLAVLVTALLAALPAGCSDECKTDRDCPAGQRCFRGSCQAIPDSGADADADADRTDGLPDDVPTPDADADVPVDDDGAFPDADADGDADGDADEDVDIWDEYVEPDFGPVCGNGVHEPGECCDDGNTMSGDGCETDCTCSGCETAADCDDRNECTEDLCDPSYLTCMNRPDPLAEGRVCCTDWNACTGICSCVSGRCDYGAGADCDDGLACTEDRCVEPTGDCTHALMPVGSSCDDGVFCLVDDSCTELGICVGWPGRNPCDDADPCSDDYCDEDGDVCTHTPGGEYRDVPCGSSFGGIMPLPPAEGERASYTCPDGPRPDPGPEDIFRVTVATVGTLSVTSGAADQHVYILSDACSNASCIAHGGPTAAASVSAGDYWVVVEADEGVEWSVAVSCP